MIEAVIFDMDGVLVDTEPIHTEIEQRQFRMNGISLTDEEHRQFMGTTSENMWREIGRMKQLKVSVEELIEQNKAESIQLFTEISEIPVMPGIFALLDKLKSKKYLLAVASSSVPEIIELILAKTGLKPYFKVIVSSQEAGKSKPEPDVFIMASRKLKIAPENCLVVEDSENGIWAAHSAGMSCVAYQSPGVDPKTQKAADAIFKNFDQLGLML
jgi:HAD superfamily hydrolase (TIGR01509 family)